MKRMSRILGMAAALLFESGLAHGRRRAPTGDRPGQWVTETYYFANVGQQQEMNELITAVRHTAVDPKEKLSLVPSQKTSCNT